MVESGECDRLIFSALRGTARPLGREKTLGKRGDPAGRAGRTFAARRR